MPNYTLFMMIHCFGTFKLPIHLHATALILTFLLHPFMLK